MSYITKEQAVKLLKVCIALDEKITGLYGKINMLELIRYGKMLMSDVKRELM